MASSTVGEISMIDALPADVWNRRDELVGEYWEWYDGLNPNNPLDRVKIEQADEILSPIIDRMEDADGSSIVRYGMDKQVKHKWNGVVGMQYQFDKRWMVRSEAGVIGDRKSFMISVNYRFLV
jgi:hypothetical protein